MRLSLLSNLRISRALIRHNCVKIVFCTSSESLGTDSEGLDPKHRIKVNIVYKFYLIDSINLAKQDFQRFLFSASHLTS